MNPQDKMSLSDSLMLVIRRDWLLAMRRRADVLTTLVFFVMVVSLFPLSMEPDPNVLRKIAPGVVWVAALLASMLSLGRLFSADHADGTLEQMMLAPQPLALLVFGKIVAHWMLSGLPLVLLAPVLGLQFGVPTEGLWVLVAGLLLGTPMLSAIGAIGAALTLGLRGGGVLVSLLVLPLCIPVLIFGAGAVDAVLAAKSAAPNLALLGAALVVSLAAAPWVAAQALRISME
ncbi:MAG: heme exporter protein CcmB [Gallionellaceae bacterium]|jgi:heme exporter protein B|nr:heme exporter protein CcmB [Gallionellaceae bacterium]